MEFFDSFPFTKLQGKNRGLDWVIQKVTEFKKVIDNIPETVNEAVAEAIENGVDFNVDTDKSLTADGVPADAKAVGDRIDGLTAEDVDAAPAGYGLGVGSTTKAVKSITANGWYVTNQDTPNSVWLLCHAFVANSGADITVEAWGLNGETKYKITKKSGVWDEWEYVNPPMYEGVEYRTVERCSGKPVYAKRIYQYYSSLGGNGVVDTAIPHGVSGFLGLVRCAAKLAEHPLPIFWSAGKSVDVFNVDATNITLRMVDDTWSSCRLYFDLYYTKEG